MLAWSLTMLRCSLSLFGLLCAPSKLVKSLRGVAMKISIKTLTGSVVTFNAKPSDSISTVIAIASSQERRSWSRGEETIISMILRGCHHQGSGIRLLNTEGDLLDNSLQVRQVQSGHPIMFTLCIRKRADYTMSYDDITCIQTLQTECARRLLTVRSMEDVHVLQDVLTPPPRCTVSMQYGTVAKQFDVQLIWGKPYVIAKGMNCKGLTYTAHVDRAGAEPEAPESTPEGSRDEMTGEVDEDMFEFEKS